MTRAILEGVNNCAEEAAMPDIKFPEMKMPEFKLPEGLRDMSREDIQRAMSEMRMPDVRLPKRSDIAKNLENALPRRAGPSPVPFAVLAMLGGLIVGWILATSPVTGPRISAAMGGVRRKVDEWRTSANGVDDELDGAPEAFQDAFRAPTTADRTAGSVGSNGGVGVGPGRHPVKTSTDTGPVVGAESVSSERT